MIRALVLADLTPNEPPKHLPHALVPLLKFHHGVPVVAGLLLIGLLVCFAFFKLRQVRSA